MQSNLGRAALGVAAAIAAVVLLIVLSNGDDDSGDTPGGDGAATTTERTNPMSGDGRPGRRSEAAIPTIVVRNGKPVGGIEELSYDAGEPIRFAVESDAADEVHVHGYDIAKEVAAGGSVRFDFPATIEGIFEVELEGRGEQIAELRVEP